MTWRDAHWTGWHVAVTWQGGVAMYGMEAVACHISMAPQYLTHAVLKPPAGRAVHKDSLANVLQYSGPLGMTHVAMSVSHDLGKFGLHKDANFKRPLLGQYCSD